MYVILIYYYTCVFLIFINKALYMLKISKGKDFLKNIYILTKEKWKKVFAWEKSMLGKRVWYSLTFLLISGGRTPCVNIRIHIYCLLLICDISFTCVNIRNISTCIYLTLRSRATSSATMEGLLGIFCCLSSFPKTPTAVCIVLYIHQKFHKSNQHSPLLNKWNNQL